MLTGGTKPKSAPSSVCRPKWFGWIGPHQTSQRPSFRRCLQVPVHTNRLFECSTCQGDPPTPPQKPLLSSCSPASSMNIVGSPWLNPRRTYKESLEGFTYDYSPTLKPRTQERYRTSFRQLNAVFGDLYLDEITRGRLTDYASDRMKADTCSEIPLCRPSPEVNIPPPFPRSSLAYPEPPCFQTHLDDLGAWVGAGRHGYDRANSVRTCRWQDDRWVSVASGAVCPTDPPAPLAWRQGSRGESPCRGCNSPAEV